MHRALQAMNGYKHFVTIRYTKLPLSTGTVDGIWAICKCGELSVASEFIDPITKCVTDHLGEAGEPLNYFVMNKEGATGM